MSQRKLQVLAPAPQLSPAFSVPEAFYDLPGGASLVLHANLERIKRLTECQQIISWLLSGPISRIAPEINSSTSCPQMDHDDALRHHVFELAIREVFSRNRNRIDQALQLNSSEPPLEHERECAVDLYAAHPDATWPEIAVARETYHATEWLLGYAASADNGRGIAISHALIEASIRLVPVPEPELEQPYQGWAAAALAGLPDAGTCIS